MVTPRITDLEEIGRILSDTGFIRTYRDLNQPKIDFEEGFNLITTGSLTEDASDNDDLLLISGVESVRQWIRKVFLTEANVFAIYDSNYGFEFNQLIGSQLPPETIQALTEVFVERALLYHPNIIRIDNYTSRIEGSILYGSFHAVLDDEEVIPTAFNVEF